MATQCIIHDKADTVGVVVVERVQPGTEITALGHREFVLTK